MDEDRTHPQNPLCVPVREAGCGFVLRVFRDRDGSRCAVAFSSEERLRAVLGAGQCWLPLAEPALRDLARPLGISALVLDPNLVAPTVRDTPAALAPAAPAPAAARPDRGVSVAAHRAPRRRAPVGNSVLLATAAAGTADLLLQLLS